MYLPDAGRQPNLIFLSMLLEQSSNISDVHCDAGEIHKSQKSASMQYRKGRARGGLARQCRPEVRYMSRESHCRAKKGSDQDRRLEKVSMRMVVRHDKYVTRMGARAVGPNLMHQIRFTGQSIVTT